MIQDLPAVVARPRTTPNRPPQPARGGHPIARIEQLSLAQIEAILESDEHYRHSPTRNYGLRDPLDRSADLLFHCPCGAAPAARLGVPPARVMQRLKQPLPSADGQAHYVECPSCGRAGKPSLREWRTVVDWNYEVAAARRGSLEDFPFFNLAGVPVAEREAYLESIRYDLALRRAQARLKREQGEDVGRRFMAKIDAYLGWVNVALRVLREA